MIISIDGSFMLHRARFVCVKNEQPTWDNMTAHFMRTLITTLGKFSPTKVYVYFDRGRSVHRREILEEYKAQRTKDPDCPVEQAYGEARSFLHTNLPSLGIISVLEDGIEADDFAYLVASQNAPGVHISDDKDWYLNLFPDWHLFRAMANQLISYDDLCKLVNDDKNPRLIYLLTRSLVGDKSDNIMGVRGFGWDTAVKFAPKILYKEDFGTGAKAKKLKNSMDIVKRNMSCMNPSWILHSDDAKSILAEAEQTVQSVSDSLDAWKGFGNHLGQYPRMELMSWWNRYNKIVRDLDNG
jgi:5'-3' exonuclease